MRGIRHRKSAWVLAALLASSGSAPLAEAAGKKCNGQDVTEQGTSGDDVITGTDGKDVIWAGAGDDEIDTLFGDDVICAGKGRDTVFAGMKDDRIWAGPGNHRITAGRGYDLVYGEDGADRILGGDQPDELHGHAGPDFVDAGSSTTGRGEGDFAYGGLGRDRLKAYGADEGSPIHLFGNKGDDTLLGEGEHHVLDGGPGTDACSPEAQRRNCERDP
jgi:2',3'-cyclic-nucleotide 2'-phosphodiesterase/3'-nucleotidase/5'-nucleotidase